MTDEVERTLYSALQDAFEEIVDDPGQEPIVFYSDEEGALAPPLGQGRTLMDAYEAYREAQHGTKEGSEE
jgi:hypothetical protein